MGQFYSERAKANRLAAKRAWSKRHPERWLKRAYGLTLADVDALFNKQDGKCAICQVPLQVRRVDHDHRTGKVRGLLCNGCNVGLGLFHDDLRTLTAAIAYLKG